MPPTGRERVLIALNHEQPDRVPIVVGACNTPGIKAGAYRRLKERLGIAAPKAYLYDWPELGTVLPDEATLEALHSDVRGVHDRFPPATYAQNQTRPPHAPYVDDWGCSSTEVEPGVWVPTGHPLAAMTTDAELAAYRGWPDMSDPARVAHAGETARRLAADGRYAVMGTPWLLSVFERAIDLQGMDRLLLNMAAEPDFAVALFAKILGYCKTLMGNFVAACGEHLDIVGLSDDLGTERGLLRSPRMYRRLLKPLHADYIAFIKARTRAKVFLHTDGDVFDLLDDLVEIGVDILNPIQTSAGKMGDLPALKRRYGRNLVFCGAIDTQRVLPFGTPEDVRREVRRVIEALAPGGGYLLAAVHTITDDVPPENILAMTEAALEFGSL